MFHRVKSETDNEVSEADNKPANESTNVKEKTEAVKPADIKTESKTQDNTDTKSQPAKEAKTMSPSETTEDKPEFKCGCAILSRLCASKCAECICG